MPRSKIKAVLQSETRIRVSLPNTASRSTAALSSQGLCHPIANSQSRRTLTTSHIAVPSGSNSRFRMMSTSASIPALSQSPAPKPIEVDLDILFSSTADPSLLSEDLQILLFSAGCGGRWHLTGQRNGLERSFKFKTFTKTWVSSFSNSVFDFLVIAYGADGADGAGAWLPFPDPSHCFPAVLAVIVAVAFIGRDG